MAIEALNPPGIPQPDLYRQVAVASGTRLVFIAGQVARDAAGEAVGGGDLAAQTEQVFLNLATALAAVGGSFDDVAKLTVYVVDWTPDKMESLVAGAMRAAQRLGFDPRTVMTMVGVPHLASPDFLIEVEALAMVD